jgi:hypothetical protein
MIGGDEVIGFAGFGGWDLGFLANSIWRFLRI